MTQRIKRLAVIGSTGSIGEQTLQVVDQHPERFQVEVLAANNSFEKLIQQAKKYEPNIVIIANKSHYQIVKEALTDYDTKVFCGMEAICQAVEISTVDTVVLAIVGCAGLLPTLHAIEAGKDVALANKEVLVVAGDIIMEATRKSKGTLLPIDSEHSAIFQSWVGDFQNSIEKAILTCSGGPFWGRDLESLHKVTPQEALKHPKWNMGAKISIDSATLMNKGLEVIEAKWLFELSPDQIDVVIHRESIIHSMVQFQDGSIKAQLGTPDMRIPIQYALSYPERLHSDFPRVDFKTISNLTLQEPDRVTFGCLQLAYDALEIGNSAPCALNAANEITVEAFLAGEIPFTDITRINRDILETLKHPKATSIDDYIGIDSEVRRLTREKIDR